MKNSQDVKKVAESIGAFIEYWGFRNIHGRIWTVIFLSPEPISTHEIIEKLDISKGLASRAINELLEYGLILSSGTTTHGRHTYFASEDIGTIVHQVLKNRELTLLDQSYEALVTLSSHSANNLRNDGIDGNKLQQLIHLTQENKWLLKAFLNKRFRTLSEWIKFAKRARRFLKL